MKEQELVNWIIEYIETLGGTATRINSGVQFVEDADGNRRAFRGAKKGTSDIIGCLYGRYCAIEAKIKPNTPTTDQLEYLQRVRNAGGIGIVAYTPEDVMDLAGRLMQQQNAV